MCYYFDDIIKFEDLNLDNSFIDEKLYRSILVYSISYETLGGKPLRIKFDKIDDLLQFMVELDIQYYLKVKNMIYFTKELDILQELEKVLQILFIIIMQELKLIHFIHMGF